MTQPLSLKTQALLKETEELPNLLSLLEYLDSNSYALQVAESDVLFWPRALARYMQFEYDYDPEFMLTRGDIETGEDWIIFAYDLVKGTAFMYSWFKQVDLKGYLGPTYGVNHMQDDIDDYTPFIITGTLPLPNRPSMCVEVGRNATLIVSTNEDDCIRRAARWALDKVSSKILFASSVNQDGNDIDVNLELDTYRNVIEDSSMRLSEIIRTHQKWLTIDFRYGSSAQKRIRFTFSAVLPFPDVQ